MAHFASEQAPHRVRVDPELFDRLEELDQRRHLGLRDQISVDFMGHNFGNRYGLPDRFFRGEAIYTHRLWRMLHSISFGFGWGYPWYYQPFWYGAYPYYPACWWSCGVYGYPYAGYPYAGYPYVGYPYRRYGYRYAPHQPFVPRTTAQRIAWITSAVFTRFNIGS